MQSQLNFSREIKILTKSDICASMAQGTSTGASGPWDLEPIFTFNRFDKKNPVYKCNNCKLSKEVCATSFYDSMVSFEEIFNGSPDQLHSLFDSKSINLRYLNDQEVKFTREFIKVMAPISIALDTLQGEKKMYLGYLLPTLNVVKQRLETLKPQIFGER